jgi:hypothetical protein
MNFDQFYGMGGAPLIEGVVNYLKENGMPSGLSPAVAIVLSFAWNLLLGLYFLGFDLKSIVTATLMTALLTHVYHELTTQKQLP